MNGQLGFDIYVRPGKKLGWNWKVEYYRHFGDGHREFLIAKKGFTYYKISAARAVAAAMLDRKIMKRYGF